MQHTYAEYYVNKLKQIYATHKKQHKYAYIFS